MAPAAGFGAKDVLQQLPLPAPANSDTDGVSAADVAHVAAAGAYGIGSAACTADNAQ